MTLLERRIAELMQTYSIHGAMIKCFTYAFFNACYFLSFFCMFILLLRGKRAAQIHIHLNGTLNSVGIASDVC